MAHRYGYQKALEFFIMGDALMAEDLKEKGLINYIDENCLDFAHDLAKKINQMAPLSLAQIKKN